MEEILCSGPNKSAKYHIVKLHDMPFRLLSSQIISRYHQFGFKNPIDQLSLSSESGWKMMFKVSHLLWMNSLLRHADIADMPKFQGLFDGLEREFSATQRRLEWLRQNAQSSTSLEKKLFNNLKPQILQTSDQCAEWLYPRRWVIQEILLKSEAHTEETVYDLHHYNSFFYDERIPRWWQNLPISQ